jgi:hypothetical protein
MNVFTFAIVNDTTIVHITWLGSLMYLQDIMSHLPDVSGCQIETVTMRGDRNIIYLQLYTTDRAITYCSDQGHYGKFIQAADLLNFTKAKPWIENICSLYNSAINTTPAHTCIEVRVGLHHTANALLNFNKWLYRGSLISIPCDIWWYISQYLILFVDTDIQFFLIGLFDCLVPQPLSLSFNSKQKPIQSIVHRSQHSRSQLVVPGC